MKKILQEDKKAVLYRKIKKKILFHRQTFITWHFRDKKLIKRDENY